MVYGWLGDGFKRSTSPRKALPRPAVDRPRNLLRFLGEARALLRATLMAESSGARCCRLHDDGTLVAPHDLLVMELEIVHAHREVAVEIFVERLLDSLVEFGSDHMGRALHHLYDFSVLDDELAFLEHVFRRREHLFAIGLVAIDGDVATCAHAEMTEVLKAETFRRPGAREDCDLIETVFAGQRFQQRSLRLRVGTDLGQHLVAEALVHQQPDEMRVEMERRAVWVVGGQEDAPR